MESGAAGEATYVFVIRGELDPRYGHLFEGMEMSHSAGTTVVIGRVRDQAQFYGLVDRIEELGLELVSAQKTATGPPASGQERK